VSETEPSAFRDRSVSYLQVPAPDPERVADFYAAVFGWRTEERPHGWSFSDGSGHVIGHFRSEASSAGELGVRPYVYVDDLDAALGRVREHGGEVVQAPYPEGDLTIATFRDPAGNVVGAWQRS